nr:hypothetical protein [Pandoravirus aubagnensis]
MLFPNDNKQRPNKGALWPRQKNKNSIQRPAAPVSGKQKMGQIFLLTASAFVFVSFSFFFRWAIGLVVAAGVGALCQCACQKEGCAFSRVQSLHSQKRARSRSKTRHFFFRWRPPQVSARRKFACLGGPAQPQTQTGPPPMFSRRH